MTKEQFKNLKVGDRVQIPNRGGKTFMSTEVLEIDRYFKKVKVLLGGNKGLSYRYVRKDPTILTTCMCGINKSNFSPLFAL